MARSTLHVECLIDIPINVPLFIKILPNSLLGKHASFEAYLSRSALLTQGFIFFTSRLLIKLCFNNYRSYVLYCGCKPWKVLYGDTQAARYCMPPEYKLFIHGFRTEVKRYTLLFRLLNSIIQLLRSVLSNKTGNFRRAKHFWRVSVTITTKEDRQPWQPRYPL